MPARSFGFFACVATVSLAWSNAALPEEGEVNVSELLELDDGREALTYCNDDPAATSSNRGIILRYMPKYDLAVCACAKCGSTSLWGWLYKNEFGHDFAYDANVTGSVQDVEKDAWQERFVLLKGEKGQDGIFKKSKTFAFIRDPKERLVSSWKSKLACAPLRSTYGTDLGVRAHLAEGLFDLAQGGEPRKPGSWVKTMMWEGNTKEQGGHGEKKSCMKLEDFAETLLAVHTRGKAHQLNSHFMPQDKSCFARMGPERWTEVKDISNPHAYTQLATAIDNKSPPEHTHSSTGKVVISQKVASLLDKVTKDEYAMLKPYLTSPSRVKAGASI